MVCLFQIDGCTDAVKCSGMCLGHFATPCYGEHSVCVVLLNACQGLLSPRLHCAGTITVEELHEALKNSATKLPHDEIQALMANVDMNASGAIDYEEFLAATLHASKVASDEHLQRAFREFDTDGSGVHDVGGMLAAIMDMHRICLS